MFFFGLGKLFYGMLIVILILQLILISYLPVIVLIINAIAVLSEDRFLARGMSLLPAIPTRTIRS